MTDLAFASARMTFAALMLLAIGFSTPAPAQNDKAQNDRQISAIFADWMRDQRAPGLCWGVVTRAGLVQSGCEGVQDVESATPANADTAFRIASMSKAFTAYGILTLADAGRLRLDDKAAVHVPELAGWAPDVTVAQLLHHMAGFVTDDPWGDRQQVLTEAEFTAMLKAGVPFHRAPGLAYEYSNFGYATLGRIVGNVSGKPYQAFVREQVFVPLGMVSTTYEVRDVPAARLAKGYRWEGQTWVPEPVMRDGAFGAMGGVVTTANDYAKWMAHLLGGWPAMTEPGARLRAKDTGARLRAKDKAALLRAMGNGGGQPHERPRPGVDAPGCRMMVIYAAGLVSGRDCLLGRVLFHSGGYPGYGSHMLLLPDAGVGIFAFSNRTYAAPVAPVWDVAGLLQRDGRIVADAVPMSDALAAGYAAAQQIWASGRIDAVPDMLAMNMLMDQSAPRWAAQLAQLKADNGLCDTASPIRPEGALSGRFLWRCTHGRISGQLLLAPTRQIQALRLTRN